MAEKPSQFKLELVEDETPSPPPESRADGIASEALVLALKALSQRALVALASLFSLLTVGAVFWLAMSVSANPSVYQIVTLGIFSAFVLVMNWIVLRRPR